MSRIISVHIQKYELVRGILETLIKYLTDNKETIVALAILILIFIPQLKFV